MSNSLVYTSSFLCPVPLFQDQGKLEAAIQEFRQAVKIDPTYVYAQNNLKEAERQLALQRTP